MSAAQQRDVGRRVVAAEDEGVTVVELEPRPRRAPSALLVDVTAVAAVPFVHRPANGCRYMPRGRRAVRRPRVRERCHLTAPGSPADGRRPGATWPGRRRRSHHGSSVPLRRRHLRRHHRPGRGGLPPEAAGLEPLELLRDSRLDDRGQIAVGHRGPHESAEALELVAERRAGRELDLVPARSEGLHECRRLESARTDLRPNGGHSVWTQFRNRPVNSVWTQLESGHRRCGWPDWRAGRRRGSLPPLRELAHQRRSVGLRLKRRDQLVDLALRPVHRPREEGLAILDGQVRRQPGDGGEV